MESQNQPQNFTPQIQQPLPNSTAVLVLGIISIVGCACYGIVGIVCGIIALVLNGKDMRLYNANTSAYTTGSLKNLKAGKVCAIIGLSLSALYIIYVIAILVIFGTAILSNPQDIFNHLGK